MRFAPRLLFYFRQFAPLQLEKGQDALSFSLAFFSLYLFLSVRNIIAEMSRCFVQGNVATTTTVGYITGKMPKESKENGEVGKSNEFSGSPRSILSSLSILLHPRYFIQPRCCQIIRMDDKGR